MTISHPYKSAPTSSFWSRAVANDWNPADLIELGSPRFLIQKDDRVVSAGSCFASNIIPYLEKSGLKYLRTETRHPAFLDVQPEALGYANFSAAYGNIYTARQLLQLLKRCLNTFSPVEDRWTVGDEIVDSLRPGLRYRARSHREFDILTAQHLRKTYEAFENADVFIFTLGLTEAWVSRIDGTVFPACPGTVAGCFDPERHEFKNFNTAEVTADLSEFVDLVRDINPDVRIVVTVSPVPLVATATGRHVLNSSIYSKAVLRVAAEQITQCYPNVIYFPAYEIIAGPQAPWEFYENDRRSVSQAGIETVMKALLARCEVAAEAQNDGAMESPAPQESANRAVAAELSRRIAEAECEEAMADASLLIPVSTEQSAEAEREEAVADAPLLPPVSSEQSADAEREEAVADAPLFPPVSAEQSAEAEREEAVADAPLLPPMLSEQGGDAGGREIVTELSGPCAVAMETNIEMGREEAVPDPSSPIPASSTPVTSGLRQEVAESAVLQSGLNDLREKCAQLLEIVAAERADFDRELEQMVLERDACAAESMRWFEAAIAISADHNPLIERGSRNRGRWWRSIARRIGGNRRRSISPIILADRAGAAGRWELAVRYYRDALDLEPNEPRLWFQCGYALRAAGKAFEADVAFRKGLEHSRRRLPSDVPPERSPYNTA